MPKTALKLYTADDSGCHHEPHPLSHVKPENRVDYITRQSLNRFLNGPGLMPFFDRFTKNLINRLLDLDVNSEWREMPDLWGLFKKQITSAAVEALCGPTLMSLTPNMAENLWAYDEGIPNLVKGVPRWWAPKSYARRDRLLKSIKDWHAFAKSHFDQTKIDSDEHWDPYFGSEFFRSRQDFFAKMDGMSDDAVAASDLGVMWAYAVKQKTLSLFWTQASDARFDIDRLCQQARFLSCYAEVLRLRIDGFIMRSPERQDMMINNWVFPRNEIVLVATTPEHMNDETWNTGHANSHPLKRFWADRFLIFSNDINSGPLKKSFISQSNQPLQKVRSAESDSAKFSLDGLAGSWIPYGGGFRSCPGQNFAKREILLVVALMITMFDIKIDTRADLETDQRSSGLGAQRPRHQVPCRIKRRVAPYSFGVKVEE
ncbi:hypothetical protein MMC22_007864 [Lobaria immixta]|nr:hypothetical protein [Lobaria immixta]